MRLIWVFRICLYQSTESEIGNEKFSTILLILQFVFHHLYVCGIHLAWQGNHNFSIRIIQKDTCTHTRARAHIGIHYYCIQISNTCCLPLIVRSLKSVLYWLKLYRKAKIYSFLQNVARRFLSLGSNFLSIV